MPDVSKSRRCRSVLFFLAAAFCLLPLARADGIPYIKKNAKPADSQGEKIEFSSPDGLATINSSNSQSGNLERNSNPLNPTPNIFKRVQDDLFSPFKNSFKGPDSMDGVIFLPPQQQQRAAPDKRTRDMMERKKNWAFTDLNDLYPTNSAEDSLGLKQYGSDGMEKKSTSLIDKYYNNLKDKQSPNGKQNGNQFDPAGVSSYSGSNGMSALMPALQNGDSFTKNLFSPGGDSRDSDHDVTGFKAPNLPDMSSPDLIAAKKHREAFDRLLDPSLPAIPPSVSPASALLSESSAKSSVTASGLLNGSISPGQSTEQHRSVLNPMFGAMDPNIAALHSRVYDDPTAVSLGMPNPVAAKLAPKPPSAEAMRRMLDPFSSSVPKPKF